MSDRPARPLRPLRPDPLKDPTLQVEQAAFAEGFTVVIGIDEVGRGAIAGPVAVGAYAVTHDLTAFPEGLRDSKLLSERRREALEPELAHWGRGAVGWGKPTEIDQHGITVMLGQAARRALHALHAGGVDVPRALILLDGAHDWLSPQLTASLQVRTRVGADRECASVAAASVTAKVARDRMMSDLAAAHSGYAWESNKGYGSAAHYAHLAEAGSTPFHRLTWLKTGVSETG